ncbi:flippase [Empedobacter falsenii]
MEVRSLHANYIFSIIRIFTSSIIGLLIISHANKSLGPIYIGKVEYANTIINYFMMFSSLGIPIYGIREIAKVRDNSKKLLNLVTELLIILIFTSIISYLVLGVVIYSFDFMNDYKTIIIIYSSMIFLSNIGAEWFFQGTEDQLYITIRYVFVRIICLVLLYIFVNNPTDYLNYVMVMVLYLCGSNIFNFYFIFKKINFFNVVFSELNFTRHIKPIITIFAAAVSVNIYLQLDNLLLGYLAGDKYLGYYSISNKLIRYVITFITVGGTVMLPRLSNLFEKSIDEYYILLSKSLDIILLFSIPASFFFFIFSEDIIMLMGGIKFSDAIITLKILSPLCIIIGVAYFIGYLVLIPQNKEGIYSLSVFFSAVFSIIINFFILKIWKQNGAAVVQILAEILSICIMLYLARRFMKKIKINFKNTAKIIIVSIFVSCCSYFINSNFEYSLINFISQSIIFYLVIGLILLTLKETTLNSLKNILLARIKK